MPEVTLSHCCGDSWLRQTATWPGAKTMHLCLGCYQECTPVVYMPKEEAIEQYLSEQDPPRDADSFN